MSITKAVKTNQAMTDHNALIDILNATVMLTASKHADINAYLTEFISPHNLLQNGGFFLWSSGTTSAPDGWTLSGTGATIIREVSVIKQGSYSAKPNTDGANEAVLSQDIFHAYYKGRAVTFGCWLHSATASRLRLRIDDGVGTAESSYHTGGGAWEYITVTRTIDASATKVEAQIRLEAGAAIAVYADAAILVEGSAPFAFNERPNIFAPDSDQTAVIGRGKLGYNGSDSDWFVIAHFDMMNATDFGVALGPGGQVIINAKTGATVSLRVNDVQVAAILASSMLMNQPIDMNNKDIISISRLNLRSATELTISGGVVTMTQSSHRIDTEGDDPTDNLDTINGGSAEDILILRAENATRTVVCKDGTGNLVLNGDFSLDHTADRIMLHKVDTLWYELSRSSNA